MDSSSFADLLGWCLAFFLPAFAIFGPLRRDRGAALAYLLAVFLHIAAAVIYVYVPGVLPTRADSSAFHNYAVAQQFTVDSEFGIGSHFFKEYLAYIYSLVGPSFFLASVLSIYAFSFSVIVLGRFMELLEVRRGKGLVIILFGAVPTAVLYGSVPLREAYQVLFFMLACYGLLRFRLTSQFLYLITGTTSAMMMGMLHKGLIVYAPFLVLAMLLVRVDRVPQGIWSTGRVWLHRFAGVCLAVGFVAAMSSGVNEIESVRGTDVLSVATGGGLVEFAEQHRSGETLSKGRTAYGVALDTSSPVRLVYTMTTILIYYTFTPFPWHVSNIMDVSAFGEVILRAAALIAIVRMWRDKGPVHPRVVVLLMLVYISMAFLWAAGTTNYGTATRHHMVHQWILLLLGVPALLQMVKRALHGNSDGSGVRGPERQRNAAPNALGGPLRTLFKTPLNPPRLQAGDHQPRRLQRMNMGPPVSERFRRPRSLTGA